ncbi:MAG: AAA family ATPase [Oscillospiraceae bacterium]|nr:AAA family ATPase [Oscillospiraceae bacterium]
MDISAFTSFKQRITENCGRVIVGKEDVVEQIAVCLIASGHILLEDLPGTGKTMLLRAFAKSIGGEFRRIQFTPDLMPSDLTGINFYNQKQGEFEFRPGPLFANVVLADEINRATPRSQSALLEVMEEKQITVDGVTYRMDEPYIVMATQNPVESYGTFPLPEAQMDRFFMRLSLGYMTREQEIGVLRREDSRTIVDSLETVAAREEIAALRAAYPQIRVNDDIAGYIMDLAEHTRKSRLLTCGVSTRGTLALYRAAQIAAAFAGRDYVIPEDVKKEAAAVLPHRLTVISGSHLSPERFVENMLEEIAVPLEKL